MRPHLVAALAVLLSWAWPAAAQQGEYPPDYSEPPPYENYSPEQLDNLLAPVALYPDPLLAQLFPAATFADQIDEAARYVRAYGPNGIDDQPWDVSVKSIAHYPAVLNRMADRMDWTTAVGQAYVNQSTDVWESVQRLRAMARGQGNLVSSPQLEVVAEGPYLRIWPASPEFLYVPVYDPAIVYFRPWPGYGPLFVSFGVGLVIGAWLNRDCDWEHHRVFYTGWRGGGWIGRSRAYVHITNVYVNERHVNVVVNRQIVERRINYDNINRYHAVHRDVNFDNRVPRGEAAVHGPARLNNGVLERNFNTGDPRLNGFRGRPNPPPERPLPPGPGGRPVTPQGPATPPVRQAGPGERPPPQPYRPPTPPSRPPREVGEWHPFARSEGNFNAAAASQRGQASRAQMRAPPPAAPRPPPPPARPAPRERRP